MLLRCALTTVTFVVSPCQEYKDNCGCSVDWSSETESGKEHGKLKTIKQTK